MAPFILSARLSTALREDRAVIFVESIVLLLLVWQAVGTAFDLTPIISSPAEVGTFTYRLLVSLEWIPHLADSLRRIFLAFGVGLVLGMVVALTLGFTNFWEAVLKDYVVLGLSLPTLIAVVFAAMYFGTGDMTPIAAGIAMTTPYNAQIIYEGLKDVDDDLLTMGRSFNLTRGEMTRSIVIPSLLPDVFSAARLSFAGSWKIVTLGEFIAAETGLGFMIQTQLNRVSMQGLLGWTLIFIAVILLIEYGVFRTLEAKLFTYREDVAETMRGV